MEVQRLCSGKPDLELVEKKTVLFVDDDEVILHSLERRLSDDSYNKFFVKSSKEALEILKQREVHVIVIDMCLPEMSGLDLLRTIRKEYLDIIGMVFTENIQDPKLQTAVVEGEVFKLIPKQWKLTENLETLIQQAIDNYNFIRECNIIRR
jgi:two-component system repressor protein LuxO